MGKMKAFSLAVAFVLGLFMAVSTSAGLRGGPTTESEDSMMPSNGNDERADMMSFRSGEQSETPAMRAVPKETSLKSSSKVLSGLDGFIAGPDWEFDGFVAGGQGQEVRSMFVANDLLYLDVGSNQGIYPGDRVGIYKRGSRVKDPQTGRFIGYEVRRIAISEITDKVDAETSSARVIRTNDGIEIGDLVRKDFNR